MVRVASHLLIGLLLGVVVAWPTTATAEVATDRFEPTREEHLLGLSGIDIATGWVPANSPIQVSFDLHVGDTVVAELPGDAIYDWDTQEVHFEGDEAGGLFAIDVGVLLDARVQFDLLGNLYESELIGPYDLLIENETAFTPYLLPGNDDRPAVIMDMTEPTEVYSYALVDAILASGEFVLDAAFDVDVQLECSSIDVTPEVGSTAMVVEELAGEVVIPPDDGSDLEASGVLHCTTRSSVTILLYPSVRVTIGLEEFELSPFELPVPVLTDEEAPFDFDGLPLLFAAPRSEGTSGTGGGDDTTGGDDSASAGSSGGATGDAMDTDDGADADPPVEDGGCSCRATEPAGPGLLLLLLAALGSRRRRE